jgi:phage-related protein
MADAPIPKRAKIVARVIVRFGQIQKANGYLTDAGSNVDYWRTGTYSEEEMSDKSDGAICVRDIDEAKTVEGDATKVNKLSTEKFMRHLHIQVELARGGTQSPSDIHNVIADIETAIRKDVRWKDEDGKFLAVGTRPRLDRSVVEQNTLKISGTIYEFFIQYITDAFNPYQ